MRDNEEGWIEPGCAQAACRPDLCIRMGLGLSMLRRSHTHAQPGCACIGSLIDSSSWSLPHHQVAPILICLTEPRGGLPATTGVEVGRFRLSHLEVRGKQKGCKLSFNFKSIPKEGGAMQTPLETTEFSAKILKKVRYSHDAMIDQIIANPSVSEIELGELFGYSKQWVSRLMCSDAFQARLALRREEIIDPKLTASFEERIRGAAFKSLEIIQANLEANPNIGIAMKVLELTTKGMNYGAKQPIQTNTTFVVALPPVVQDEKAWERQYNPMTRIAADAIDAQFEEEEAK